MNAKQLDSLVQEIRAERRALLDRIGRRVAEERSLSADLHDTPTDAAEQGTQLEEIELCECLAERDARRLADLDRALDRARTGHLGTCDACGEAIPLARLRAWPGVELCVACADPPEHRLRDRVDWGPTVASDPRRVLPGDTVYTTQGEGRVLRIAPFGTCGSCGDVEARYDATTDELVCTTTGCDLPVSDACEVALVEIGEQVVGLSPSDLTPLEIGATD